MGLLVNLLHNKRWMEPAQVSVLESLRHLPEGVQDDVAQEVVRVIGAMRGAAEGSPQHSMLATHLDELMNPEKMVAGSKSAMDRADSMFPVKAYSGRKVPLELDPDKTLFEWGAGKDHGTSPDGVNRKVTRFFSESPETAESYVEPAYYGQYMLPARLNLGKNLEVDTDGAQWGELKTEMVPDEDVRRSLINDGYDGYDNQLSTDNVARHAAQHHYDSVTFRNIRDRASTYETTPTDTVHAMMNQSGIRAKTAKFSPYDRRKYDLLASALATAGLGGGLLALSKNKQRQERA